MKEIDHYFSKQDEPIKGCLLFLRAYILALDKNVTEVWRYRMPFYCYKGKRFCYLWVHQKKQLPYLGIVDGKQINHPDLVQENRSRMKIVLIDPEKDIAVKEIRKILNSAIKLHQ